MDWRSSREQKFGDMVLVEVSQMVGEVYTERVTEVEASEAVTVMFTAGHQSWPSLAVVIGISC